MSARRRGPLVCPSAQPEWDGAVAIGIVGGTAEHPHVRSLEKPVAVSDELLELADPVQPTEVFRFAATCLGSHCRHFRESRCSLAAKIVWMLPVVVDDLPECGIRHRCRWFAQEGGEACLRCPQVATHDANRTPALAAAADPATPVPM